MSDAAASSTAPLKAANGHDHEASNGVSNKDTVIGFRPQAMAVIPPREQDLQQSYASIVGNDANPKGWYGSMSKLDLVYQSPSPSCTS
jgi:hypothetical protein